MRIHSTALLFSIISIIALSSEYCLANQSGGIPLRIPDSPTPRCINYNTDKVWLTLYRVVSTRKTSWFTSDNQAEMIINVQVKTDPQSDKPLAFPSRQK